MRSLSTSILFALVVLFAIGQVSWWMVFLAEDADRLEQAGDLLAAGRTEAVSSAFGAKDGTRLAKLGRRRRTMFLAEGTAFLGLTMVGAILFARALRRERSVRTEQDRFLAAATHELKTPLTTLRLGLESLRRSNVNEQRRVEYSADMLGELGRLEAGVTNILSAAGLRTTQRTNRREPGDLSADVHAAIESVRRLAAATGIQLQDGDVATVEAHRDPEAYRLLVQNLLDNAVKYTPSGGVVSVALERVGERARLTVSDTGEGFSAAVGDRLFEPFRRGRDDARGGLGLGLHLVQQLARAHGGTVTAASPGEGQGSTFVVEIPAGERA